VTDQAHLKQLQAEKKRLEDEIRQRRARLSELRLLITGDKDNMGLAARVEMQRRKQEWIDGEPTRAAMRATPEWQAWRAQFMADEKARKAALVVWWGQPNRRS